MTMAQETKAVVERILNYIDKAGHFEGKGKERKLLIQGTLDLSTIVNQPSKIKDASEWFTEWIEYHTSLKVAEQKRKDVEIARNMIFYTDASITIPIRSLIAHAIEKGAKVVE